MSAAVAEKPIHAFLAKNFMSLGKPSKLNVKECVRDRRLQVRSDTANQPGGTSPDVDEGRASQIGTALKSGKKVQPIKVMVVKDMPGHKDEEVQLIFDGFHTHRGCEIEKLAEVEALVWTGTWSEALTAAAMYANREHEANGRPLSTKDKIRAVELLAAAYKGSDIPKKEWPSNRQAAEMCGCSRQLINDMDPFDRGGGDVREAKAAAKRGERAAAAPKAPKHFNIVAKSTGTTVAGYDAENEEAALKRHKETYPEFDMKSVVAKLDTTPTKKPAQASAGFDWAGMDANLGYLIRGLDAVRDVYGLKDDPDLKAMNTAINVFAGKFKELRQKYAKKPAAK